MTPDSKQQSFFDNRNDTPHGVLKEIQFDLEVLREINQVHVGSIQNLLTENRRLVRLTEDLMIGCECHPERKVMGKTKDALSQ